VTVEVVGFGDDDPQPATAPIATTAIAMSAMGRRRFFHPNQQIARAKDVPEVNGLPRGAAIADVVLETVRVVVTAPPDGVTVDGEKLHEL
jgi:hypothetical protein